MIQRHQDILHFLKSLFLIVTVSQDFPTALSSSIRPEPPDPLWWYPSLISLEISTKRLSGHIAMALISAMSIPSPLLSPGPDRNRLLVCLFLRSKFGAVSNHWRRWICWRHLSKKVWSLVEPVLMTLRVLDLYSYMEIESELNDQSINK